MSFTRTGRQQEQRVQRRLERLIRKDDARGVGSVQDSAFFKRNPGRSFRMRLASPGEIAAIKVLSNKETPLQLPRNAFWWTVVKQIAPGVRARLQAYAPLPPGEFGEVPEEIAREIFGLAADSDVGALLKQIEEAARKVVQQ